MVYIRICSIKVEVRVIVRKVVEVREDYFGHITQFD